MPLLPPEIFLFPEHLFDNDARVNEGQCRWWVLYTRPRMEKCLARAFLRLQLAFFLPVQRRKWRRQGRWAFSYLPLFPGYVFLNCDPKGFLIAQEMDEVVQVLPVEDQGQLHGDLARLHQLIQSDLTLTPEKGLLPGSPVLVIAGPLAGLQGNFLRVGNRLTFFVEVRFLQRRVIAEVDSSMIQLLESSAEAV
jgi:transcriptional antiterminator NusG